MWVGFHHQSSQKSLKQFLATWRKVLSRCYFFSPGRKFFQLGRNVFAWAKSFRSIVKMFSPVRNGLTWVKLFLHMACRFHPGRNVFGRAEMLSHVRKVSPIMGVDQLFRWELLNKYLRRWCVGNKCITYARHGHIREKHMFLFGELQRTRQSEMANTSPRHMPALGNVHPMIIVGGFK